MKPQYATSPISWTRYSWATRMCPVGSPMNVSPKGRECVDALFPQAQIAWRESDFPTDPSGDWGDWRGFEINLPDVVAQTETKLPLEITGGADLDEAQPDALALLLAIAVKRQGGRSAYFARGCMEIFHPDNQQ